MSAYFTYSLLKYQHSQALGEVLNVGLLLCLPQEVRFLYPRNLARLKGLYPNVEDKFIREHLKGFAIQAGEITRQLREELPFGSVASLDTFARQVQTKLLPSDDSMLFFAPFLTSVLYTRDYDKIAAHLYKEYFYPYEQNEDEEIGQGEEGIVKRIQRLIKNLNQDVFEKYFKSQKPMEIKGKHTSLQVSLHWENSCTHLVYPISFDLKRSGNINNKANRYFGNFAQLRDELEGYALEIPTVPPRGRKLSEEYDKALKILSDIPRLKLIEINKDKELELYVEGIVEEISAHGAY